MVLDPEDMKELQKIVKDAKRDLALVMIKSLFLSIGSIFPIIIISAFLQLLETPFPMFAGFATVLLIHFKYFSPKTIEVAKFYDQKVKEVLKDKA